jgi:K+-transporting ATPase KdpF subunit
MIYRFNYYQKYTENIMNSKASTSLLSLLVVPIQPGTNVSNGPLSYLIGGIIALLILGYLIYTLLRPDKF